MQWLWWLCVAVLTSKGWCANILGLFVMPSYSHYTLGHRLLEELAAKGHTVTMVAPYKQNRKIDNYKEVYLEGLSEIIGEKKTVFYDMEDMYLINQIVICYQLGYVISEFTLNYPPVIDLLHSNETYDLVIMDQFLDEAVVAIPYHLKAPLIYLCTLGTSLWNNHLVANPAPLSHVPNLFSNYKGKMNFWQRFHNLLLYVMEEIYRRGIAYPIHNSLVHKRFPDAPQLEEIIYGSHPFVLVNSHVSTNDPVPHVPNMVEIGGFHPKAGKLPDDLQQFLDEAKEGVVFFAMGSNLRVAELPEVKRVAILKALGKLKQKVLWKWEEDSMPGQPSNVMLRKWLPQQAILAHPNTKAFISHGGLLSTIEAVYFGVPVVGIPIYADQKMNINLAVNRGYAVAVPYKELTEEKLTWGLNEVLNTTRYRENIRKRSALMKDRVVHPMKEAIYWVEHVIRFKGAEHFRSPAMDLRWYEYEMLDVAACIVLGAIFMLSASVFLLVRLCNGKSVEINTKKTS